MKLRSAPKVAEVAPKPAGKGAVKTVAAKRMATPAPAKKVAAKKAAAPMKPQLVWVSAVKVGAGRSTRTIYGSAMQPKHRSSEEIAAAVAAASAAAAAGPPYAQSVFVNCPFDI